jgi:hypothetical protein
MPSYKFGGIVMAYLKDDKMPEGIQEIDNAFNLSDATPHPFFEESFRLTLKAMAKALSTTTEKISETIDNVIYDSRLVDIPIEERKRREAAEKGKAYRVPEWWRGERANYNVAKNMMVSLPKKIGPIKE